MINPFNYLLFNWHLTVKITDMGMGRVILEVALVSHTPAHESATTVAPFRAWRGS